MDLVKKFWPRQMVAQLVLLLLVALLLANLIAVTGTQLTGSLLHPLSRSLAVERLSVAYQMARQLSSADELPGLTEQREDGARFWLAKDPEVPTFALRSEERQLREELMRQLALSSATLVTMQLERTDGGLARSSVFSASRWSPLRLRSSVKLPDGRFLNGVQPVIQAYEWGRLLSWSLPVASVPLMLISIFFIFRVVRPIRTLAVATDRLSRGEWTTPLPLTGPSEARDLTRSFNLMQIRLARHIESRTGMLAAMSHDLNTPITELRLQVELLEAGQTREDMLESLNDLRAMVSETLNFIRGESSQECSQRCSLSLMLAEMVRRYRLQGKAVSWQGPEQTEIICRPLALKRALGNLIDNALAYAGDATLVLTSLPEGICIEVLDHGPGIAAENLLQAFEPFVRFGEQRLNQSVTSGGGLGLGLSIARACIHAHGGELTLENRPPAGLCAVVLLPDGIRNQC